MLHFKTQVLCSRSKWRSLLVDSTEKCYTEGDVEPVCMKWSVGSSLRISPLLNLNLTHGVASESLWLFCVGLTTSHFSLKLCSYKARPEY